MKLNDQVKTNDFYVNNGYGFKKFPFKLATIISIRTKENQTLIELD